MHQTRYGRGMKALVLSVLVKGGWPAYFVFLFLLQGLTVSSAFATEIVEVSQSTTDEFSEQAMEQRLKAIQLRCLENENCAKRNATRLQVQVDDFARAKKDRSMAGDISDEDIATRKDAYDKRCLQNEQCTAHKARREARRGVRDEAHKQRKTASLAFKEWCLANVATCDDVKAINKKVFKGIAALQPDCEHNYDLCVTTLRELMNAQRDAWKPFCSANPKLCQEQEKVTARFEVKRNKEHNEVCQAQSDRAICTSGKKNFSAALSEANEGF